MRTMSGVPTGVRERRVYEARGWRGAKIGMCSQYKTEMYIPQWRKFEPASALVHREPIAEALDRAAAGKSLNITNVQG